MKLLVSVRRFLACVRFSKYLFFILLAAGVLVSAGAKAQTTIAGSYGFGWKTAALPDGRIVVSQSTQTEVKVLNANGTVYGNFRPCNAARARDASACGYCACKRYLGSG